LDGKRVGRLDNQNPSRFQVPGRVFEQSQRVTEVLDYVQRQDDVVGFLALERFGVAILDIETVFSRQLHEFLFDIELLHACRRFRQVSNIRFILAAPAAGCFWAVSFVSSERPKNQARASAAMIEYRFTPRIHPRLAAISCTTGSGRPLFSAASRESTEAASNVNS